jgi:hypothetical protein
MMPVRPRAGVTAKITRYDGSAAIWPQMWMPVRQTSSKRYDASSASFMTPIKSVTVLPKNASPP